MTDHPSSSSQSLRGKQALAKSVGVERFDAEWKDPQHRMRRLIAEFIGTSGLTFVLSSGAAILALDGGAALQPWQTAFILSVISALWLAVAVYFLFACWFISSGDAGHGRAEDHSPWRRDSLPQRRRSLAIKGSSCPRPAGAYQQAEALRRLLVVTRTGGPTGYQWSAASPLTFTPSIRCTRSRRQICCHDVRRSHPCLYSEDDVAALIAATQSLGTHMRRATYATLIGLLAVPACGSVRRSRPTAPRSTWKPDI
jgi:hypothetical protein